MHAVTKIIARHAARAEADASESLDLIEGTPRDEFSGFQMRLHLWRRIPCR
jgi:hypothetical protein